ncbi:hypothetical protein [Methyloligella solikamskensis]|uniref:Uncharacterized protein n=1 Tax=Methyloligella solikamskensis TaxID=1177756 RepID=A0ABW3JES5_9HYPH
MADSADLFRAPALVAGRLAAFVAAAFFTASCMAAELFTAEFSVVVAGAALGFRPLALTLAGFLADAALLAARFFGAASSFAMMSMLRFASSGSKLSAF